MSIPKWEDTEEIQTDNTTGEPGQFSDSKLQDAIAQIESNKKHDVLGQPIKYGMDKGKRAIGKYQFTPSTIDTIAENSKDPALQGLYGLSDEDKANILFKNPKYQDKLFNEHLNRVKKLVGNDPEKIAFAWNQGPGNIKNFDPEHDYVQKFRKASGRSLAENNQPKWEDTEEIPTAEPEVQVQQEPMSKTEAALHSGSQGLTAGFYDELAGGLEAVGGAVGLKGLGGPMKDIGLQTPTGFSWEDAKKAYIERRNTERATAEKASVDQPTTSTIANIGGGIATSFIPGLNIAKGATLGKAALQGAKLGIIGGYGASNSDTIAGDIEAATLGGALGAGGGYLGQKLGNALTPKATEARAITRATKALGGDIVDDLGAGKAVLEEGVLPVFGGSKGTLDKITGKMTDIEENIVQPGFKKVLENEGFKKVSDPLSSLKTARNAIEKSIDDVIKSIDPRLPVEDIDLITQKVTDAAKSWENRIFNAGNNPFELNEIRKSIDKKVGEFAFKQQNPKPVVEVLLKLRDNLNAELRNISSKVTEGVGENLAKGMQRQSKLYRPAALAEKLVEKDLEKAPGSIMNMIKSPMSVGKAALTGAVVAKPLVAAGVVGKIAAEKATGQPINRLGNILLARSQYGLATSKLGNAALKAGEVATKGAGRALSTTGVQSGVQNIYTAAPDKLKEIADSFSQSPTTQNIGEALNKAIESGDDEAKNKVLFAAEQNPAHRARIRELLALQEEQDNSITTPFDDTGFDDET